MTTQAEKMPRWATRLAKLAGDLYWAVVIGLSMLAFVAFFGGLVYVIFHFIVRYW